jgi:cyclopropane fatty-acyl-phospholipid synthase-like methyltransferase
MPYSYTLFKDEVKSHFLKNIHKGISILDVGPGCGTYSHLLKEHFPYIDAIEIFENYISQFDLHNKYNNVILGDIRDFDFSDYDYIIMGDILEHLSVSDARTILDKIEENNIMCMVAIPYLYEQGTYMDNVHETHLQPDLTHDIFMDRYPMMKPLIGDDKYGYYINYDC